MNDQRILIELDCLLDTRLGTLSKLSQQAAANAMNNDLWVRETDDFQTLSNGLVTNEAYKTTYALRDVETLARSFLTNIVDYLGNLTRTLQHNATDGIDVKDIYLTINTNRYDLTNEEIGLMIEGLRPHVALTTQINAVKYTIDQLTPGLLNANYDSYILYDFDEWDKRHREQLMKNPMPEFSIVAPRLHFTGKVPDPSDLVSDGQTVDPFRLTQLIFMERLDLEFLPVFFYSVTRPATRTKTPEKQSPHTSGSLRQ